MKKPLCITCDPADLDQGLFGNVLAHPFQILPYLFANGIFPAWELRTQHYGDPPDRLTIPGVVDLAYTPPAGPYRRLSLVEMRRRHGQVLGGDWEKLARIWNAYFRTPARVVEAADARNLQGRVLGVHYRGTDKQVNAWDSNPISQAEFTSLLNDFLATRPAFDSIIVGTDEPSFVDHLRANVSLPVSDLGAVEFHMSEEHSTTRREKSDRAMLDCLLFSRCVAVVQTSSALPSFAKVFNPKLDVYRTAASKLFSNMPYFPVAYVPVLPVASAAAKALLDRTMKEDWTSQASMQRYRENFVARPRWPRNHSFFQAAERAGAADLAARFVTGFR